MALSTLTFYNNTSPYHSYHHSHTYSHGYYNNDTYLHPKSFHPYQPVSYVKKLPPSYMRSWNNKKSPEPVKVQHKLASISSPPYSSPQISPRHSPELNRDSMMIQDRKQQNASSEPSDTRPDFTYASLISQAILSTPNKMARLNTIYQWIMDNHPYFKSNQAGWQNSIRHNLSLNKCFRRVQPPPNDRGKGHFWEIHPDHLALFTGNNSKNTENRSSYNTTVNSRSSSQVAPNIGESVYENHSVYHGQISKLPPPSVYINNKDIMEEEVLMASKHHYSYPPTPESLPYDDDHHISEEDRSSVLKIQNLLN